MNRKQRNELKMWDKSLGYFFPRGYPKWYRQARPEWEASPVNRTRKAAKLRSLKKQKLKEQKLW